MNAKTSLILALIFIVMGSFAIFDPLKIKSKRQEKQERENSVFWLKDKKLIWLEIAQGGGAKKYRLRCVLNGGCPMDSQGDWRLEVPLQDRADNNNIGSLLSSLDTLASVDRLVFDKESASVTEFGFDKPSFELRFQVEGESKESWVRFGAKTSVGSNYYAQSSGSGRDVLLVASYFPESLNKDQFHWRNKRLFPELKTESIDSYQWESAASFSFSQVSGKWKMLTPLEARANSGILNGIAGSLAFASALSIPFETKEGPEALKFLGNKPDLVLRLNHNKSQEKIEFFLKKEKAKTQLYARTSSQPWVAEIESSLVDRFTKSVTDYRFKQLVDDETRAKLAQVLLEFPRDKQSAKFVRKDGINWAQSGGDPVVHISQKRLARFIELLNGNEVQKFEKDPEKAKLLDKLVDLRVRIMDTSGSLLQEFTFTLANKDMALTQGELKDEVRVLGGEFLHALPIRLKDLEEENNKQVVVEEHGHEHGPGEGPEEGEDGHSHSH